MHINFISPFIEAQPLVCNASSLGAIIPGPLVELDQLSQALCSDPQKLSGLLQAIKDNLNQAKLKQLVRLVTSDL